MPDGLATNGLCTMIGTSSTANPFHRAPRYTTTAQPATAQYRRLVLTGHPVYHPTPFPLFDGRQPTRVRREQGLELGSGKRMRAGDHDVRRALPLEVGTLLRWRRADHGPAAIAVDVERHARATGVQPKERLEIGGNH